MKAFLEKYEMPLSAISVLLRLYLGGVFVYAGIFKISEPFEFAVSVATYLFLPLSLINVFSIVLPWIEVIIGLTFIMGLWIKESAFCIAGMMVMFLIALSWALSIDLQLSCGCFASQEAADEIGMHTVFRDLGWLAIAVYVMAIDTGRFGIDGLLDRRKKHA